MIGRNISSAPSVVTSIWSARDAEHLGDVVGGGFGDGEDAPRLQFARAMSSPARAGSCASSGRSGRGSVRGSCRGCRRVSEPSTVSGRMNNWPGRRRDRPPAAPLPATWSACPHPPAPRPPKTPPTSPSARPQSPSRHRRAPGIRADGRTGACSESPRVRAARAATRLRVKRPKPRSLSQPRASMATWIMEPLPVLALS